MIKPLLLAMCILALGVGGALFELQRRWQEPLVLPPAGYVLVVESGESLASVSAKLGEAGILRHPLLLRAWARYVGLDVKIRHGEFLLRPPLTPAQLLETLARGDVIHYQVTLPEGITLRAALQILAAADGIETVLGGVADPFFSELTDTAGNPEGLFFPDTYRYERGATDRALLERAYRRMQEVLADEWPERAPQLPFETPYEALVMASLIERETGVPSERPDIAGVFVRRLARRMRLQTDPAVIYGLGDDFDGNLTRAHLRDDGNPYNTYRHFGLPPTPIALPGRASIHAALHPADGDTLYFVARGDGSHEFSVTLAEHQAAVRRYQLQRREDYRSRPDTR
jgi:UPF0755 protein